LVVGWTSASRLGAFSRYLQVHFYNLTLVTAVQLEHPVYLASAVQQYRLHYSNDGINWIAGSTVGLLLIPVSVLQFFMHCKTVYVQCRITTLLKNVAIAVTLGCFYCPSTTVVILC